MRQNSVRHNSNCNYPAKGVFIKAAWNFTCHNWISNGFLDHVAHSWIKWMRHNLAHPEPVRHINNWISNINWKRHNSNCHCQCLSNRVFFNQLAFLGDSWARHNANCHSLSNGVFSDQVANSWIKWMRHNLAHPEPVRHINNWISNINWKRHNSNWHCCGALSSCVYLLRLGTVIGCSGLTAAYMPSILVYSVWGVAYWAVIWACYWVED